MLSILYWVILGSLAGGVARSLLPSNLPQGWLPTIALGVAGSIAGGVPFGEGSAGIVGSIAGAVALLCVHRLWSNANAK